MGGIFNWCLYGCLVVQFCEHRLFLHPDPFIHLCRRFKTCTPTTLWKTGGPLSYWARELLIMAYEHLPDSRFTVYCIFFLETLQTSLNGADLYYWFASGFGDMNHLTSPYASAFDTPIMGALVSFCVQMFFVYRIWVLGKKKTWWLCGLIIIVRRSLSVSWSYLTITVDLICRCNGGVLGWYLCEPPSFRHMQNMAHLQQTHIHGRFARGTMLKILAMVRSPSTQTHIPP